MNDDIILLKKKLDDLKYKDMEDEERKKLKQEIWRLEHKKTMRFSSWINNMLDKFRKKVDKTSVKVIEWGNNYQKNSKKVEDINDVEAIYDIDEKILTKFGQEVR